VPTLRLMTYNIKHGAESSLEQVADVINAEQPDLVALQEVDVDADRSGNVDQPHRLSQLTGMASLFRSATTLPTNGLYGVALLSRFPIISSSKLLLTSGSEQRILMTVDVELDAGWLVPIGVTHMGSPRRRAVSTSCCCRPAGRRPARRTCR
jgi:endonuclease/exonuclease/phosphatase family metal-dependent hydrolase